MTKYRPDIDGLRAVAVLAVVFYHFEIPGFRGGYVGVDIFFVISGYLITSLILEEISQQKFSILRFYDRRIRRILPALFFVLIVTLIAGFFILLPKDLETLGKSIVSVSVFASNFFFMRQSGYFDPDVSEFTLLHTWSLSVEEQFYVVWPILLMLLYRVQKSWVPIALLLGILMISLLIGEWLLHIDSEWDFFYFTPVRIWELVLGAILSVNLIQRNFNSTVKHMMSLSGFIMIVYAIFYFSRETKFPGINALIPCFGVALIIYSEARESTLIGRMLSIRPIVFLGLISYSLYLWHWPIMSYLNYYIVDGINSFETGLVICFCIVLSAFTWKFIEQPFRRRSGNLIASNVVILRGLALTGMLFGVGMLVYFQGGYPQRLSDNALKPITNNLSLHPFAHRCISNFTSKKPVDDCLFGAPSIDGSYQAVLWGDSHASHYMPVFKKLAEKNNWTIRQVSMYGCSPHLFTTPKSEKYKTCPEFNQNVLNDVISKENIKLVIFAGRWTDYPDEYKLIVNTISKLKDSNKKILILGQVPEADFNPAKCLAMSIWHGWSERACDISMESQVSKTFQNQNEYFRNLSEQDATIQVFLPEKYLCDDKYCVIENGGISFYKDNNHFHQLGSSYLIQFVDENILPTRKIYE